MIQRIRRAVRDVALDCHLALRDQCFIGVPLSVHPSWYAAVARSHTAPDSGGIDARARQHGLAEHRSGRKYHSAVGGLALSHPRRAGRVRVDGAFPEGMPSAPHSSRCSRAFSSSYPAFCWATLQYRSKWSAGKGLRRVQLLRRNHEPPRSDLKSCLFFLLVNPTVVFPERGSQFGPVALRGRADWLVGELAASQRRATTLSCRVRWRWPGQAPYPSLPSCARRDT